VITLDGYAASHRAVAQLKEVVVRLSDKEFEELVEAREQAWDRQIEADAEAGKFDQLAEEALRDYREGKCIRLP
jgi:hypothetical protein